MSGGKNQRALLMEIMVAVLFFGLCATVLLQTFTAARTSSANAGAQSAALTRMQVIAEQLYAADDMQALLEGEGFVLENENWILNAGDYTLSVALSHEDTEAGVLAGAQLQALRGGEAFASLPCLRYIPEEAMA